MNKAKIIITGSPNTSPQPPYCCNQMAIIVDKSRSNNFKTKELDESEFKYRQIILGRDIPINLYYEYCPFCGIYLHEKVKLEKEQKDNSTNYKGFNKDDKIIQIDYVPNFKTKEQYDMFLVKIKEQIKYLKFLKKEAKKKRNNI